MKQILIALLALTCFGTNIEAKEDPTPKKVRFSGIPVLNLSVTSEYSYEQAMNRFHYMKPDGYVIESIRYNRRGRLYVVTVTLRKI